MATKHGRSPSGPGLRPSGAEPAEQSQAEPLVPNADCRNCAGERWVCENHQDTPWESSGHSDNCGAGAPCPVCNHQMACAAHSEPWRQLAYRAISLVGDAIKDTNWGQPTFGDDYEEELLAEASAIEAATAGKSPTAESGDAHD